jgi:uncharacterized membrane protein
LVAILRRRSRARERLIRMGTGRLEAFSDGVIAIIITIMVLELTVPGGDDLHALAELVPELLSYALSFVYVGIYWNNHHHMLQTLETTNGPILWANLHLLFWLSLIPFVTAWMGEHHFASTPLALYGVVLLCASIAYFLLQAIIIRHQGEGSLLAKAIGRDRKGLLSPLLYAAAIPASFFVPWIAGAIYVGVALLWLVPDRRIERTIGAR